MGRGSDLVRGLRWSDSAELALLWAEVKLTLKQLLLPAAQQVACIPTEQTFYGGSSDIDCMFIIATGHASGSVVLTTSRGSQPAASSIIHHAIHTVIWHWCRR